MRPLFLLLLIPALAGLAIGQDTIWTRLSGQGGLSRAAAVRCAGTDVFVTGLDRDTALGRSTVYVVRYDGEGNQMWNRTLNLAPYETGGRLATGPDGQPYVSLMSGRANPVAVLTKLNVIGDTTWTLALPGLALGPLLADQSNNCCVLAQRSLAPPDDTLLFLCFRPDRSESLHVPIPLLEVERLAGLCRTAAGNYVAAVSVAGGHPSALLVKLTGEGIPLWTVPVPDSVGSSALAVAARGADDCYLLAQGPRGVMLAGAGPGGNIEWVCPVGGGGAAADVGTDQAGNGYVVSGEDDCRIDKFSPAGALIRSFKGGTALVDLPVALALGHDDNPVVAATAQDVSGTTQVLAAKFQNVPVGIFGPESSRPGGRLLGSIRTDGRLELEVSEPGEYRVKVFDAHGRMMTSSAAKSQGGRLSFGLPGLPGGVYFAHVSGPIESRHKLVCGPARRLP